MVAEVASDTPVVEVAFSGTRVEVAISGIPAATGTAVAAPVCLIAAAPVTGE